MATCLVHCSVLNLLTVIESGGNTVTHKVHYVIQVLLGLRNIPFLKVLHNPDCAEVKIITVIYIHMYVRVFVL
jgi:hypothetical protein